ncbi:hypothetical protein GYMLUDRAFT_79751 [Collybiopsis luxurians FD-317 M1]|nr:hypothetical protein GYMLUDRAFT_79751 [Collybiopsis luxurians FD-317 M1]
MASLDDPGKDGLDNYEILEQVASSPASNVYRARCKRGRLKNRLIALKKLSLDKTHSPSSISLYQTLCHPCIVSLFSIFSTSSHRFQVLEFCSGGSLSTFLTSRSDGVLSEGETRSVLRSILDGLAYLNKNSIVHRNINLENVKLTDQCRVKLSNLDLAIRLPCQDFAAFTLTHPEYVAPEFLSRRPYDCSADLWSLGCLIFTCLVGKPPFQGPSMDDVFEKILHGRYKTPETISTLAGNFISSLIQLDPKRRQDLISVSFDPFLDSRLPETHLKISDLVPQSKKMSKAHPLPFRVRSSFKANPITEATRKRPPLQNIQNADLRRVLSDEISLAERRIVSDPGIKSETAINCDSRRHSSLNLPNNTRPRASKRSGIQVSSPDSSEYEHAQILRKNSRGGPEDQNDSDSSFDSLPVGTSRPLPLNTALLSARVHKTVNGQITVLPSRSLLVDFREGERRRGKPGIEVFVVSPEGEEVKVYSAPHLSTPCCLVEPVAEHRIDSLPREYWTQYNDAATLIDRLKQRTPRMIVHEPNLKCALMANAPQADVELIFSDSTLDTTGRTSHNQTVVSSLDKDKAYLRLRYSRQMHSLEIAKCAVGPQGKEWKKRTVNISRLSFSSEAALNNLSKVEMDGIKRLSQFVRICEAVEGEDDAADRDATFRVSDSKSTPTGGASLLKHPLLDECPANTNRIVSGTGSRTLGHSSSMSSVDLAPRPRKFLSKTKYQDIEGPPDSTEKQLHEFDYSTKNITLNASEMTPSRSQNGLLTTGLGQNAPEQPLQTRYIPSVGWCIRYGSKVSQGGRYKIMFLDGDVVDINVDEEWVEHVVLGVEGSNERQRLSIREGHLQRALSERLKVFEEFVSMFEATETSYL